MSGFASLGVHGWLALVGLMIGAAYFVVRPDVWHRLFLVEIDPRPLGLMRIAFGAVAVWTFLTLGPVVRFLFTDEGLWLTDMAGRSYGAPLGSFGSLSILHWRSDPPTVFAIYAALLVCLTLMTLGAWAAWTTPLSWLLAEQLYGYASTGLYGTDSVVRVYLFLGMFSAWGEAYSVDSWRARRRAVLGGASALPGRRKVPAWPVRLMMLELACIYCSSGLLKSGITWRDGTALYYVLNGDHLYRFPAQTAVTWLQYVGVLPVVTWLTRWWEVLFPVVLAGVALQGYEADRQAGTWPAIARRRRLASWALAVVAWCALAGAIGGRAVAAAAGTADSAATVSGTMVLAAAGAAAAIGAYRLVRRAWPSGHHALLHWLLGRRTWLGFGVLFHLGIEAGTNIGTFPAIMLAVYFCWLAGSELERLAPWLVPRRAEIRYHPDAAGVRRAALARLLAPWACQTFTADPTLPAAAIRVEGLSGRGVRDRALRGLLHAASRL